MPRTLLNSVCGSLECHLHFIVHFVAHVWNHGLNYDLVEGTVSDPVPLVLSHMEVAQSLFTRTSEGRAESLLSQSS